LTGTVTTNRYWFFLNFSKIALKMAEESEVQQTITISPTEV
jgi:hypothetical protein